MEAETERRYGFQRLENERIEKAKATEIDEVRNNSKRYQRIPRRIVRAPQKTDMTVVKKYRRQVTDEKLNKVNIKQKWREIRFKAKSGRTADEKAAEKNNLIFLKK